MPISWVPPPPTLVNWSNLVPASLRQHTFRIQDLMPRALGFPNARHRTQAYLRVALEPQAQNAGEVGPQGSPLRVAGSVPPVGPAVGQSPFYATKMHSCLTWRRFKRPITSSSSWSIQSCDSKCNRSISFSTISSRWSHDFKDRVQTTSNGVLVVHCAGNSNPARCGFIALTAIWPAPKRLSTR